MLPEGCTDEPLAGAELVLLLLSRAALAGAAAGEVEFFGHGVGAGRGAVFAACWPAVAKAPGTARGTAANAIGVAAGAKPIGLSGTLATGGLLVVVVLLLEPLGLGVVEAELLLAAGRALVEVEPLPPPPVGAGLPVVDDEL